MFYRVEIDENDDIGISLVDRPAIEIEGVMLNNVDKFVPIRLEQLTKLQEDKQIVAGVALVADKWIYRYDEKNGEYYITFTPDQVVKFKTLFEEKGYVNLQHGEKRIKGSVVDLLLVGEKDDYFTKTYNFDIAEKKQNGEIKDGDLLFAYKIQDNDDWNFLKDNGIKSFSIEAFSNHSLIKFEKNKNVNMENIDELKKEIQLLKDLLLQSKEDSKIVELEEKEKEEELEEKEKEEVENEEVTDVEETETETFEFTEEMYNDLVSKIAELESKLDTSVEETEEELEEKVEEEHTSVKFFTQYRNSQFN